MLVKELKEYIQNLPDNSPIQFEDVCGNWTFDLYSVEFDKTKAIIIGDEILYEDYEEE